MKYEKWLNIWLDDYVKPGAKERTYIRYEQLIRTHIAPEIGNTDVNDLTPVVLQSFAAGLSARGNGKTGKGLAASTVNDHIGIAKFAAHGARVRNSDGILDSLD